jgi:hypothetical protein
MSSRAVLLSLLSAAHRAAPVVTSPGASRHASAVQYLLREHDGTHKSEGASLTSLLPHLERHLDGGVVEHGLSHLLGHLEALGPPLGDRRQEGLGERS